MSKIIEGQHTVNKCGEWIIEHRRVCMSSGAVVEYDRKICPNCKHSQMHTSNYCPHCGAKMCDINIDININKESELN